MDDGDKLKLQGKMVNRVKNVNYLGFLVRIGGSCEEEVRRRIQAGWMCCREMSWALCDMELLTRVKRKIWKSVIIAAMLYGMETVAVTKKRVLKVEITELKMLRWVMGVKKSIRLEWIGEGDGGKEVLGRRILEMTVPGRRKRGRPKR